MDICLIPARAGSKRIKNKNIISFFGKPIISYAIKTAIKSKLFDKVLVTTDSIKIAKISKNFGAEIPFIRPKKIAGNTSIDIEVIEHFLNFSKKQGLKIRYLCYMYATTPLLKISTLKKCKRLLKESKTEKVITIGKFQTHIEHALKKNKVTGNIHAREKEKIKKRTQTLTDYYYDASQCYWYDLSKIKNIKNEKIKTKAVILKYGEFLDIDTPSDLAQLKEIYKNKFHKLNK